MIDYESSISSVVQKRSSSYSCSVLSTLSTLLGGGPGSWSHTNLHNINSSKSREIWFPLKKSTPPPFKKGIFIFSSTICQEGFGWSEKNVLSLSCSKKSMKQYSLASDLLFLIYDILFIYYLMSRFFFSDT